jgi:hypothetical protein
VVSSSQGRIQDSWKIIRNCCVHTIQLILFFKQRHFNPVRNIHRKKTLNVVFGIGKSTPSGSSNHQWWIQGRRQRVNSKPLSPTLNTSWQANAKSKTYSQQGAGKHWVLSSFSTCLLSVLFSP